MQSYANVTLSSI